MTQEGAESFPQSEARGWQVGVEDTVFVFGIVVLNFVSLHARNVEDLIWCLILHDSIVNEGVLERDTQLS